MTCPGCNFHSVDHTDYCIRCGFSLAKYGALFTQLRGTWTWILRRSLAGFAAGMAGWLVIPAAGRAAGDTFSQAGHLLLTGRWEEFFSARSKG